MSKKSIIQALDKLKKESKKRNFSQSVDLIVTLRDVNVKNPAEMPNFYASLPANILKKRKICAFVGSELVDQAKKSCDKVITQPEFDDYDKKAIKKLANEYDYFIAQANLMVKVAAKFGRILGTRGKMPNPKAGCVVPPKGNVQAVVERLQTLTLIKAKKAPVIYVTIGKQDAKDEDIAKNVSFVIDQIMHHLPNEKANLKSVFIKYTMSKPVKLDL
jgi:large subunit ribosomal protein L1